MLAMDVRHFQSTNEVVNMFWILTSLQLSREIAKGLQIRLFKICDGMKKTLLFPAFV